MLHLGPEIWYLQNKMKAQPELQRARSKGNRGVGMLWDACNVTFTAMVVPWIISNNTCVGKSPWYSTEVSHLVPLESKRGRTSLGQKKWWFSWQVHWSRLRHSWETQWISVRFHDIPGGSIVTMRLHEVPWVTIRICDLNHLFMVTPWYMNLAVEHPPIIAVPVKHDSLIKYRFPDLLTKWSPLLATGGVKSWISFVTWGSIGHHRDSGPHFVEKGLWIPLRLKRRTSHAGANGNHPGVVVTASIWL